MTVSMSSESSGQQRIAFNNQQEQSVQQKQQGEGKEAGARQFVNDDDAKQNNLLARMGMRQGPNAGHNTAATTESPSTSNNGLSPQTTPQAESTTISSYFDVERWTPTDAEMEYRNGDDGNIDYGRAPIRDDNNNLIGEVTVRDVDDNGILETVTRVLDTDGDGVFDSETTYGYGENGGIGIYSKAMDHDGDGTMDYRETHYYDSTGGYLSTRLQWNAAADSDDHLWGGPSGVSEEPKSTFTRMPTPEPTPRPETPLISATVERVMEVAGVDSIEEAQALNLVDENGDLTSAGRVLEYVDATKPMYAFRHLTALERAMSGLLTQDEETGAYTATDLGIVVADSGGRIPARDNGLITAFANNAVLTEVGEKVVEAGGIDAALDARIIVFNEATEKYTLGDL